MSPDARYEDAPVYGDQPGTTTTQPTTDQPGYRDDVADRDDIDRDHIDRDDIDRDDTVTQKEGQLPGDSSEPGDLGPDGRPTAGGPVLLPADAGPEPTPADQHTNPDSAPVTIVDADDQAKDRTGDVDDAGKHVDADKDVDGDKDLDVDKKAARAGDLSAQAEWRELQGRFVDDPQSTVKEAGALIEPKEVADAIMFMLTRPRNVTIRDIVVLPSAFDI
jgi:hypothetical protein